MGYNPRGRKELDVIERLSMHIEGSVVLFIYLFLGWGQCGFRTVLSGSLSPSFKILPLPVYVNNVNCSVFLREVLK